MYYGSSLLLPTLVTTFSGKFTVDSSTRSLNFKCKNICSSILVCVPFLAVHRICDEVLNETDYRLSCQQEVIC